MKYLLVFLSLFFVMNSRAQLCPGGGSNYTSAVDFQDSWVYGCLTGTSCNGGTGFDNRTACEPAAVDPCATNPTGATVSNMGSDLWFRFVAPDTAATINVIKNVSLMAAIQVFKDSNSCANLTEISSVFSANPSGPVTAVLSNLIVGDTYVFRVYGHSNPVSQRTGAYCFCGTTGLTPGTVLPVELVAFNASLIGKASVHLHWSYHSASNFSHFELERKWGTGNYEAIAYFKPSGLDETNFSYTDILQSTKGDLQYRLKIMDMNGSFQYSDVKSIFRLKDKFFKVLDANQIWIRIFAQKREGIEILTTTGRSIFKTTLKQGMNDLQVSLAKGIYLIRDNTGSVNRINID